MQNAVDEFLHSKRVEDVTDCITETVEDEKIAKSVCFGHFLVWAFSKRRTDFQEIFRLIASLHKSSFVTSAEVEEVYHPLDTP